MSTRRALFATAFVLGLLVPACASETNDEQVSASEDAVTGDNWYDLANACRQRGIDFDAFKRWVESTYKPDLGRGPADNLNRSQLHAALEEFDEVASAGQKRGRSGGNPRRRGGHNSMGGGWKSFALAMGVMLIVDKAYADYTDAGYTSGVRIATKIGFTQQLRVAANDPATPQIPPSFELGNGTNDNFRVTVQKTNPWMGSPTCYFTVQYLNADGSPSGNYLITQSDNVTVDCSKVSWPPQCQPSNCPNGGVPSYPTGRERNPSIVLPAWSVPLYCSGRMGVGVPEVTMLQRVDTCTDASGTKQVAFCTPISCAPY